MGEYRSVAKLVDWLVWGTVVLLVVLGLAFAFYLYWHECTRLHPWWYCLVRG